MKDYPLRPSSEKTRCDFLLREQSEHDCDDTELNLWFTRTCGREGRAPLPAPYRSTPASSTMGKDVTVDVASDNTTAYTINVFNSLDDGSE